MLSRRRRWQIKQSRAKLGHPCLSLEALLFDQLVKRTLMNYEECLNNARLESGFLCRVRYPIDQQLLGRHPKAA